ncbi:MULTISPECIES: SIMPL domain-containing protein [unclassified Luteimonas]
MIAMRIAFLVLLLLAQPAWAQVNALPSLPHLLVKGEANRDVVPDRFTVSMTLATVDMSPGRAREQVQANLATLIDSLKGGRAIAGSIDAAVFSIAPEYEYENNKRVFKGTRAARQLRVTFPDADSTRGFLSGLVAGEEVMLNGIQPAYSGEEDLRADLKAEAMKQARATADLLARSYGTRIRGLYSVSDVAPSFAYGVQAGQWPRASRRVGGLPAPPDEPPVVFDAPSAVDSVTVTGSRITPESIEVGTINIAEHLYAIFLLAD